MTYAVSKCPGYVIKNNMNGWKDKLRIIGTELFGVKFKPTIETNVPQATKSGIKKTIKPKDNKKKKPKTKSKRIIARRVRRRFVGALHARHSNESLSEIERIKQEIAQCDSIMAVRHTESEKKFFNNKKNLLIEHLSEAIRLRKERAKIASNVAVTTNIESYQPIVSNNNKKQRQVRYISGTRRERIRREWLANYYKKHIIVSDGHKINRCQKCGHPVPPGEMWCLGCGGDT